MVDDFEIEITDQGWIDETPGVEQYDLCSHGDVRLVIGGRVINEGNGLESYGISLSALALLRTLDADHSKEKPVVDQSPIPHGCGGIMTPGCPIGIDWRLSHLEDRIRLDHVRRCDSTDSKDVVEFSGVVAELAWQVYRGRVVAYAEKAKEPFIGVEKLFEADWERELYEELWAEYDRLLDRFGSDGP